MKRYIPQGVKRALRRGLLATQLLRRRRYVFVISHMRSYSSLLCHILGSHPTVSGYVESHQSYHGDLDLVNLALNVSRTTGSLRGPILLDKILHGKYTVSPRVHQRPDVSIIFLVREPEATIRSTVAMAKRRKKPDWKSDPRAVAGYYQRRLDHLVALASERPRQTSLLVADRLIDETDEVLYSLGSYLGLETPLSASYETFELTGAPVYGDPGKYISAGRIIRDRDSHSDIVLDAETVDELTSRFRSTVSDLKNLTDLVL